MNGFRAIAAALLRYVVILLATCAGLVQVVPRAWPQTVTQDGQRTIRQQGVMVQGLVRADSTGQNLTMDGSGNLKVLEAAPLYEHFRDGSTPIISRDTMSVLLADSSTVIDMHGYRIAALAIRAVGSPATSMKYAIQIRFHLNAQSDTASVFPWYCKPLQGVIDTTANYDNASVPGPLIASRSEFTVTLVPDQSVASWWGSPATAYIMLGERNRPPLYMPYMSVRIRCLTGARASVRVYLIGTAL